MSALRGFRVVELAEGVAGEYCGKLLADFGAEIIKVERRGSGSPTRAMAPLIEKNGVQTSGLFAYLNTNKKSVALDLTQAADLATMHRLIAAADVVIDDQGETWMAARGLDAEAREQRHSSVVFCSITPFGAGAPQGWETAKSLNVFHTGGWGYHTPTAADPARPPLKGAGRFTADYEAAIDAALCVVSCLFWRKRTGLGQTIEISAREVLLSRADAVVGRMLAGEAEASSARTAYDMGGPGAAFACANGFVYLMILHSGHWAAMKQLLGQPAWMDEFADNWLEFACTDEAVDKFRAGFGAWVLDREKDQVSEEAQKLGIPLVPVNDASDLHRSPQFQYRQFFKALEHPDLGQALYPTTGYRLSASPTQLVRPAPRLGQQSDEILRQTERSAARPVGA
jgi:crotonobetainyl-CoA:carnitine CoA-transferase CaiB-like acyl-CoA transferase